jgi:hypothetical protein
LKTSSFPLSWKHNSRLVVRRVIGNFVQASDNLVSQRLGRILAGLMSGNRWR